MQPGDLRVGGCYILTSSGEVCQITRIAEGPTAAPHAGYAEGQPNSVVVHVRIIKSEKDDRLGRDLVLIPAGLAPLIDRPPRRFRQIPIIHRSEKMPASVAEKLRATA